MKVFMAMIAAVLATGCVDIDHMQRITAQASPRLIGEMTNKYIVIATLADGSEREMVYPRDFGDALCSDFGCVRKSDIVTLEYTEEKVGVGEIAIGAIVIVPVLAALAGVVVVCHVSDCDPGPPVDPDPPTPTTKEQIPRQWIDGLFIKDGKTWRIREWNTCMAPYGGNPAPAYATDAEALETIWQTRLHQSFSCLDQASKQVLKLPGDAARDRAIRLWALGAVKARWYSGRCIDGDPDFGTPLIKFPVGVPSSFDLGRRRGDPKLLQVIAETLVDPDSYIDETSSGCEYGVIPKEDWPSIIARVKTLGPFAPQPPEQFSYKEEWRLH